MRKIQIDNMNLQIHKFIMSRRLQSCPEGSIMLQINYSLSINKMLILEMSFIYSQGLMFISSTSYRLSQ